MGFADIDKKEWVCGLAVFLTIRVIRCRDRRLDGPLEINITAMIIGVAVFLTIRGDSAVKVPFLSMSESVLSSPDGRYFPQISGK